MSEREHRTAELAFERLCAAGETGDWTPLLDMLDDDFDFLFPAGAHQARLSGPAARAAFEAWARSKAETSRSRKTPELRLFGTDASGQAWAVFGVDSRGEDRLGRFETHVALFFRVRGDRVTGYREYIGDIAAWI